MQAMIPLLVLNHIFEIMRPPPLGSTGGVVAQFTLGPS
jgi:hypothetical protein